MNDWAKHTITQHIRTGHINVIKKVDNIGGFQVAKVIPTLVACLSYLCSTFSPSSVSMATVIAILGTNLVIMRIVTTISK